MNLPQSADRRPLVTSAALLVAGGLLAVPSSHSAAGIARAVVNGSRTYQTMAGFGASEAFGQARVVMKAAPAMQRYVLNLLYSRTRGAGLTILRNEISADQGITIEPNAPAGPSARPGYVPLGNDQGQEWLAHKIRVEYGVTNVFADAWSAPAFMKTNGNITGNGTLCGVPGARCAAGDWRRAYARYLVRYARDYAADGMPLSYIGPVNEPEYASPNYDGMVMSPAQITNFLAVFWPILKASRLPTRVECCAAGTWPVAGKYATAVETDRAALSATALYTSHGYWVPVDSRLPGWHKPVWETEWAPLAYRRWDPAWDDGTPTSGITWAQNIYAGLTKAWLNAVLYWWGTETPAENGDNEALIRLDRSKVMPSGRLWAYASYSRYIRPGAIRIAVSSPSSELKLTAFKNIGGTIAIVALNTANTSTRVIFVLSHTAVRDDANVTPYLTNATHHVTATRATAVRGDSFTAFISGRSVVTYVITP